MRSIPGKSDDAVGYLRTGEKKTPRRVEAHSGELYAHITRRANGCKPRGLKDVCSGFFARVRGGVSDPIVFAALRPVRT